jgi:hypothetical protein
MAKQRITAAELNGAEPYLGDDEVGLSQHSPAFAQALHATAGPSLGEVITAAGGDEAFNNDPAVMERFSIGVVEPQNIAYTEQRMTEMRGFAESQAALNSSGVQQFADPQFKQQLKEIASKAALLPVPDTIVHAGAERIILSPAVTRAGASFDTNKKREEALDLLTAMVGQDKTIEVISCARSAGITFVKLPILWLSQMLAVESKKSEIYDDMPRNLSYSDEVDSKLELPVPQAIAKLFSIETARNIQTLARVHQVSMVYVLTYLVERVCKNRRSIVRGSEGEQSKYNDLKPTISEAVA